MTIETIPGSRTRCYLITLDPDGCERVDDRDARNGRPGDALVEALLVEKLRDQSIIDCILMMEASGFIDQGGGPAGARGDIAKPAVAHAFWQAIATPVT